MLNFENFDFESVEDIELFVSEIFGVIGVDYSKTDPMCKLEIRRFLEEYTNGLRDYIDTIEENM